MLCFYIKCLRIGLLLIVYSFIAWIMSEEWTLWPTFNYSLMFISFQLNNDRNCSRFHASSSTIFCILCFIYVWKCLNFTVTIVFCNHIFLDLVLFKQKYPEHFKRPDFLSSFSHILYIYFCFWLQENGFRISLQYLKPFCMKHSAENVSGNRRILEIICTSWNP